MQASRVVRVNSKKKLKLQPKKVKPYPKTLHEIEITDRYWAIIKKLWARVRRFRRQMRELKFQNRHLRNTNIEDDNLRYAETCKAIAIIQGYEELLEDTVPGYQARVLSYSEYRQFIKSDAGNFFDWRELHLWDMDG